MSIETCAICFKEAMRHGGGLSYIYIDNVRHWKPKSIWKGAQKKVQVEGMYNIFCYDKKAELKADSFVNGWRAPGRSSSNKAVPIA